MQLIKNAVLAISSIGLVSCVGASGKDHRQNVTTQSVEAHAFNPRPTYQRIPLIDKNNLTPAQQKMLESRADFNLYKTLAHHVELYNAWSPLGQIMLSGSTIDPRHREIAMLRMGWLCQAEYEWAQHARIAHDSYGFSPEEIRRIAVGPDANGWSETDQAVIHMVDELRYDGTISDTTWAALSKTYSDEQKVELLFTAAQYQLVSMALNSFGIQLDEILEFRLPTDLPLPPLAEYADASEPTSPRMRPLQFADMNDNQKALIAARFTPKGQVPNFHRVMLNSPLLYGPRADLGDYINKKTVISPRERELLILRTAALLDAEYVFVHHSHKAKKAGLSEAEIARVRVGSTAHGWSDEDALILRAAEDLRREAFITDDVWAELSETQSRKELVEIVYTVGVYSMNSLAVNTLGVELEAKE